MYNEYGIANDELIHYGVPGMKWGKRKALPVSNTRKRFTSSKQKMYDAKARKRTANAAYSKAFDRLSNGYANFGARGRANRKEFERTLNESRKADEAYKSAKKAYKSAKKNRKNSIDAAYEKIRKDSSYGERFLYNEGTRKKAAKYMVDNNMSMKDAKKKANKEAIRNSAIALAALGAYAVIKR